MKEVVRTTEKHTPEDRTCGSSVEKKTNKKNTQDVKRVDDFTQKHEMSTEAIYPGLCILYASAPWQQMEWGETALQWVQQPKFNF